MRCTRPDHAAEVQARRAESVNPVDGCHSLDPPRSAQCQHCQILSIPARTTPNGSPAGEIRRRDNLYRCVVISRCTRSSKPSRRRPPRLRSVRTSDHVTVMPRPLQPIGNRTLQFRLMLDIPTPERVSDDDRAVPVDEHVEVVHDLDRVRLLEHAPEAGVEGTDGTGGRDRTSGRAGDPGPSRGRRRRARDASPARGCRCRLSQERRQSGGQEESHSLWPGAFQPCPVSPSAICRTTSSIRGPASSRAYPAPFSRVSAT